ncbi:MAG: serine/threonine-protein kinase [Gloeotrichia echinulata CP02]|jgi:serine/threonine protein kinase
MELDVQKGNFSLSKYPDFSDLGYQVIKELGRNREAGRITYLANSLKYDQQVVIKEFLFANLSPDLSGLKAYEWEIEILQQLNHSRIPRYVDSFETSAGFYLVLEYKKAPSLGSKRCFHPEEIKQIAVSMLEILVYLQQRIPPIIHRDIKPENILVDQQLNAYLVDFGLARVKGASMTLSSFADGTPGFMPPEELLGYPLDDTSDLYSLGATLICLLTRTRPVDIGKLIDDKYRFNFQELVPQISPRFGSWLMKMVEHKRKRRYPNAEVALSALKPIYVLGADTGIESLVSVMKLRTTAAMLGLTSVGILAIAGTILLFSQQGRLINQFQEIPASQGYKSRLNGGEKR